MDRVKLSDKSAFNIRLVGAFFIYLFVSHSLPLSSHLFTLFLQFFLDIAASRTTDINSSWQLYFRLFQLDRTVEHNCTLWHPVRVCVSHVCVRGWRWWPHMICSRQLKIPGRRNPRCCPRESHCKASQHQILMLLIIFSCTQCAKVKSATKNKCQISEHTHTQPKRERECLCGCVRYIKGTKKWKVWKETAIELSHV